MHGNASQVWADRAQALKQAPGWWQPVLRAPSPNYARAVASRIRRGKLASFRDGIYEARTRGRTIEARYVGVPTNRKADR